MANLKKVLKTAAKVSPITAAISSTASAAPVVKEFFDPKSGIKPKTLGGWGRKFNSKANRYVKKNYPKVYKKLKKIQYKTSAIEKKLNKKIQIKISKWKNPEAWKEYEKESKAIEGKSHGGRIKRKGGGAALRGLGRAFLKGGRV